MSYSPTDRYIQEGRVAEKRARRLCILVIVVGFVLAFVAAV